MNITKTIAISTLALLSQLSYAQITTTKVAEEKEEITTEPYDSLQNFLGEDVHNYIGQDLYLKGNPESQQRYGYDNFLLDYTKETFSRKQNVYKCCDSYNSKYDDLAGKYFNVIAVHKHPKAEEDKSLYGDKLYLELMEKESGDKVYFEYNSRLEFYFPFIVVGYFEKIENSVVGQKFVFANRITASKPDVHTGSPITNIPNQRWECTGLTIEEEYYELALVVKDSLGQTMIILHEQVLGRFRQGKSYTEKEANAYEQKFGKTDWLKILDSKVVVGFTEEMVRLSWGSPKKINRASYGDQWVYDEQYLYFENGKLKSFN